MTKELLNRIVEDTVSRNIFQNQECLNNEISKDVAAALNDNPELSFKELIGSISNSYMESTIELSVKSVIDILVQLKVIQIDS